MFQRCDSGIGKLALVAALTILISLMSFPAPEQGNAAGQPPSDEYRISVDVGLVVLPVIVTDHKGMAVSGLSADSFQVFEDGRPQHIALFEPEDVPVTVGLVIDNSGSMRTKRAEVVAAALEFAGSSNPDDQMFVVNFNQTVSMGLPKEVPFTSDSRQLKSAITRIPASGNTALYDGLATPLDHLKTGTANRKALIVISDGGDNASRLSFRDLLKRAEASNAQIYTLGVFDEHFSGDHPAVLKKLAKATGGKAYFPDSASQIVGLCQQIARDLRHQYTIGYHPINSDAGSQYRAIRVTARAAGDGRLHVYTRAGYLMPSSPQTAAPVNGVKASL
jgi:VWFA-related protein